MLHCTEVDPKTTPRLRRGTRQACACQAVRMENTRLDNREEKPQVGLAARLAISGVGGFGRGLALAWVGLGLALANIRILTLATVKPQMGLVRVARALMEKFTLWRPSSRPLCSFL